MTWLGQYNGIRRPTQDETPLSHDEVVIAAKMGLISHFDPSDIVRKHIPCGQWQGHQRDNHPLHFFNK